MADPEGITCVHAASGLCPMCQTEYDEDPLAWLEFGQHPAGIANWQALQAEMLADAEESVAAAPDDPLPF